MYDIVSDILLKGIRDMLGNPAWSGRIQLQPTEYGEHGDYATSVAFELSKVLGKQPAEVAGMLAVALQKHGKGVIEKAEAAGPGFVNIFLSYDVLVNEATCAVREKKNYGEGKSSKTMVVDYSGPNIAKSFGIGHLRSTIIGQAIYNLYRHLGWKVVGDNHLGDWGTPHGKVLYQVKTEKLKDASGKEAEKILSSLTIQDLEQLYVDFSKKSEANPMLEDEAREWFRKLEMGDKEAKMIWEATKEISLREFERIYALLGVKIDYAYGESYFEPVLGSLIQTMLDKGVARLSDGALIVSYPEEKIPPAILRKSDGATTYFTRDLATIQFRMKKWSPDLIVYETGAEQELNFKQVFWAAELMGWAPRDRFMHVMHGLYRSTEGKFSTRKGNTIHLEDVLAEAVERAVKVIESSETSRNLSQKEMREVAEMIGIGGVKYNDLLQHPRRDIVFDWDKILNLKGNSAPYIQYAYARCKSILRKKKVSSVSLSEIMGHIAPDERMLLVLVSRYPEIVREAATQFSPNLLCTYLLDLSRSYNAFYHAHRVVEAESKEIGAFRALLTGSVAEILAGGLGLLGIRVPERM